MLLAVFALYRAAICSSDYMVRILIVMCINAVLVALAGARQRLHRRVLARPCRLRRRRRLCLRHPVAAGRSEGVAAAAPAGLARRLAHRLPAGDAWRPGWSAAALAVLVGSPLMRLSGHFVSVATMGFLIIVNVVLINADDFTRGARTFTGVPLETTLPWAFGWLVADAARAGAPGLFADRARHEGGARRHHRRQAIGIDVLRTRLSPSCVGAFFAGVGGSLYAHYLGSFSPNDLLFRLTINLISMLVLGGMGA